MMQNLADLGFDNWFRKRADALHRPDCRPARISRVDRERYLVLDAERELRAEPTGKLLYAAASPEDLPCVGDWVLVQYHNEGELAIVHEVLPRRTRLRRKAAGERVDVQMIAANIDTACIVQSCDANFNLRRMERYIVMAADGGIEPLILLSKSDLVGAAGVEERIAAIREAHIDARVVAVSAMESSGLEQVKGVLARAKTYCLLGSSGVGKTTMLNGLLGYDIGETAPVREKDGRGRHTTTRRELTVLDGGALVIDTPGMRELGLLDADEGMAAAFDDVVAFAESCRFDDCTHTAETGCGVLAALSRGELSDERYQSYLKLLRETAFNDLSYAERRKRDRDFGRMMKVAMDDLGKRKPRAS